MNKEMILKLLSALSVKLAEKDQSPKDGEIKEDDAVKLVEDLFKAENLGLLHNRDELLGSEKKLKEKISVLENSASESNKRIGELDAQLKKNSPEENKKFYESQLLEAKTKFEQEMAGLSSERDKYRESHFTRVRDDAINESIKDLKFREGLKDGFISIAMMRNQFKPNEVGGKTAFINQENKTLQAVLHEFSLSKEGKAYLENTNSGGGSQGGNNVNGTGSGTNGTKITRSEFMNLNNQAKMDFTNKGGVITDN